MAGVISHSSPPSLAMHSEPGAALDGARGLTAVVAHVISKLIGSPRCLKSAPQRLQMMMPCSSQCLSLSRRREITHGSVIKLHRTNSIPANYGKMNPCS